MEVLRLFHALIRRKWLLVEAVAFFLAAALLLTALLPRQYQATAKVIVESSDSTSSILSELGLEEMALSLTSSSDEMQDKLALAVLRPVLTEVVWKLQLRDDDGRILLGDKLVATNALEDLLGAPRLQVTQAPGTRIILVQATTTDPELSRLMADTAVKVYVQQAEERARADLSQASTFVRGQLENVQRSLDQALASIAEAQRTDEVVDIETEVREAVGRVSDLLLAEEQGVITQRGLRAQIAEQQALESRESIDLVSPASTSSNATVRDLREALASLRRERDAELLEKTEKHPDVLLLDRRIAAAEAEMDKALHEQHELSPPLALLRSQLAAEQQKVLETRQAITRTTAALGAFPEKMRRLSQLELAADATEKLFVGLQQEQYQIGIASALTMSDLQFVEPALEPDRPVQPRLMVNLAAGLLLGVLCGIGLVFAFEYLDDSIRTPDDLRLVWDLPQLGTLPRHGRRDEPRLIVDMPAHAPVAEAYRTVRNSIAYATVDHPPHSLAVTSGIPEEGKSTVAMNLAISMARDGRRVVIIDADFRRPAQHRFFPDTGNHVGVTNVLLGEVRLEEALQALPIPGLQLLASGTLPGDPGALVESLKMRQLLLDVGRQCDVVVVDTPPVMVVHDAVVVGRQVDGLVVVVEAGRATRRILLDVRRRLESSGITPIGLVLNKLDRAPSLGGYDRYYREYYRADAGNGREPGRRRGRGDAEPAAGGGTA